MNVTVLGSGTLLPSERRRSPAHLVEFGETLLLMDCGPGTVHGFDRHRVPWRRLTHVALTHFHTDHVGDLAALLFALEYGLRPRRTAPLVLLGPPGLRTLLERLGEALGRFVTRPGFPLEVVELERDGTWLDGAARLELRSHPTPHTAASLAFRVVHPDGDVGYTGDTGPSAALGDFFRGVALLIAECSLEDPAPRVGGVEEPPGVNADPEPAPHLTPSSLAALAGAAAPGLLLVTHLYPPLRPHRIPTLLARAGYPGEVVAARDGTSVVVEQGRARLAEG